MTSKPTVLSLFSGCGGLDLGFAMEGFEIVEAYDHWAPAVETHNKNKSLIGGTAFQKSLALKDNEITLSKLPDTDVILGGPPCQGYSFAGKQRIDDPRNFLYLDFKKIVEYKKPKVFLLENVRGLEKMALSDVKKSFAEIGYNSTVTRAKAIDLGIPQTRERVIIVGTPQKKEPFRTPEVLMGELFGAKRPMSILEAIGDLPAPTPFNKENDLTGSFIDDHCYHPFSQIEGKFIVHIPNGGYYKNAPRETLPERLKKIYDNPIKYKSPRLFPKPDPNDQVQTIPASSSPSIGGVIAPDLEYKNGLAVEIDPAEYTENGIYKSPNGSRRFTPREIARLQTFPDSFTFTGRSSTKSKMIGNAVPVEMARVFAEEIKKQVFS